GLGLRGRSGHAARRAREREERGGEVFTRVEGTPLSEPFVVLGRGSPSCRHRPCTYHSQLIVPGRLNESWMSGTLPESNVYRTGCSRWNAASWRTQSPRNRTPSETQGASSREHGSRPAEAR